ncbi:somatostatin receptor type 1-like [Mercenaria mercenaria]|uniref:somatostatin receptor type 1-like n=1 Tax=Mercenaria mercenaria TaxID=6596 RepID=UPI00234EA3DC|nr:somatostatin receptor type 1-like [Mercenaria mercenaria]
MDQSLTQYPEHRFAVLLWKCFPPVFIVIGTCGNLLTITVLSQRKNRNSATSVYITMLASCDIVALWTPLLTHWIKYTFEIDLTDLSSLNCKIFFILTYFSLQCSSLMIVVVTSERAISVLLPHKVKNKCRPRNAIAVSVTICVCLLSLNIHWLFGVGVKSVDTYQPNNTIAQLKCRPLTEDSKYFIEAVWPWIDLSILYLIPLVILIAASIAFLGHLRINTHRRQNQIAPITNSMTKTSRKRMSSQLTKTLLTLDIVFFLCTTPVTIYMTIFTGALSSPKQSQYHAVHELWWAIVNMLMFFNNTVNFILYFLSGSRFRDEVKNLLCRKKSSSISAITGCQTIPKAGKDTKILSSAQVNKCTGGTRATIKPTAGTSIEHIALS